MQKLLDNREPSNRNDTVIKEEDGETTDGDTNINKSKIETDGNIVSHKWRGEGKIDMTLSLEE